MNVTIMEISSLNNFMQLMGAVLIFAFILIATYVTTKWVGTYQQGQSKNKNIKSIETFRINQGKYIQIIKISNKYIAIAVSKDNVEFLTEINEEDLIRQETDLGNEDLFKDIFNKAIGKLEKRKNNIKK